MVRMVGSSDQTVTRTHCYQCLNLLALSVLPYVVGDLPADGPRGTKREVRMGRRAVPTRLFLVQGGKYSPP